MAEKEDKKIGEGFGLSGFTIGILSVVFAGFNGLILAVIGFFFCMYQQKKSPTKLGKMGVIISVIGFIASILSIIMQIYILGSILQQEGLLASTGVTP